MATPDQPKCGAKKRDGTTCRHPAGYGTDHPGFGKCKYHMGMTPAVRKAGFREMATQLLADTPITADLADLDPYQALLGLMRKTAAFVQWLELKVESAGPDGLVQTNIVNGLEKPSVWAELYADERDRLGRLAKLAIDAGIAERQVQLAEQQGALIAQVIEATLTDLGLNDRQLEAAPAIVRRHLLALPAG